MKALYKGNITKRANNVVAGQEYFVRFSTGYQNGRCVIRLTLDNGVKFTYSSVQMLMKDWKIIQEEDPAFMDTIAVRDAELEELWGQFGDLPMNPEAEEIEEPFLHFQAGTNREDIWRWFDERYSKGVVSLLYGEPSKERQALSMIMNLLAKEPRSYDTSDDPGFWSRNDMILCPSEAECEFVANFLSNMLRNQNISVQTGYFDPYEDAKTGEQDDFTGFYYISFD